MWQQGKSVPSLCLPGSFFFFLLNTLMKKKFTDILVLNQQNPQDQYAIDEYVCSIVLVSGSSSISSGWVLRPLDSRGSWWSWAIVGSMVSSTGYEQAPARVSSF